MKRFFFTKRGFSLIEVLLAVSILATGTIGVLRAYAKALDVLSRTEETLDIVGLLKSKMADFQQEEIDGNGFVPDITLGGFSGKYESYKWEIFSEIINKGKVNKITLLVSQELEDRTDKLSLTTYFTLP